MKATQGCIGFCLVLARRSFRTDSDSGCSQSRFLDRLKRNIWKKTLINFNTIRVFHKLDEIGNNANIGLRGFTTWKQKKSRDKMLPLVGTEPGPLMNLWFQVQHSPSWTNWAFSCETETLGSFVFILYWSPLNDLKSKNQVMHYQRFKYPLSSTCPLSSERRVLDLESEVHERPNFIKTTNFPLKWFR